MRLIDADALKEDLTRFYDNEVTARDLIDEQPTVVTDINVPNKWISVKDRLQEQGKTVLAARKYVQPGHKERRYVETAELIGTSWVSIEDEYKIHRQFHTLPYAWMPLPKPPKEGEVG